MYGVEKLFYTFFESKIMAVVLFFSKLFRWY